MAKNKYDRFIEADLEAGKLIPEEPLKKGLFDGNGNSLTPWLLTQLIREKFGKWGVFHIDNADTILLVSKLEHIAPELLAVTWLNESTFRFYCEANKNGQETNFQAWDVGPMQVNVGYTLKDITVKFFSGEGINIYSAFGDQTPLFSGDPILNLRLGARKLRALGRASVIGKDKQQIAEKLTLQEWEQTPEDIKNLRRAMLYTRPDARNARYDSYEKFAPLFKKFFEVYNEQ
jgi:hypothetical protein